MFDFTSIFTNVANFGNSTLAQMTRVDGLMRRVSKFPSALMVVTSLKRK